MTSLFPHAAYAEDQHSAHAILYLHVTRAAAMAGSFLSLITAPVSALVWPARSLASHKLPFATALLPRLLIHSSRGLVVGSIAGVLMTWGRMRGKEEIEWQDRSWRLLENEGEKRTDWWTFGGTSVGAVAGLLAARRGRIPVPVGRAALGGAGVGMNAGIAYMVYSYAAWREPA
ncbi:hypothetical protein K491DRAFT_615504 [Lophiostoma macrostomum CBS 122681]|uniref:Uncharacterized protein n=1 Tax=Lophiostoma macrostomum CBS 122681 TaxID=1314788 RepID=A0A6A6SGI1_9PLEO|nr:hypothetical protein K491DRAFT_615504 [Lophiostoma macrostomum CBS 122681]